MNDAIQSATDYCHQVQKYLAREGPYPGSLPNDLASSLKFDAELKNTVDDTIAQVEERTLSLIGNQENHEKLVLLYDIDRHLFRLHEILHLEDQKEVTAARDIIVKAIPQLQRQREREFARIAWWTRILIPVLQGIRILTILVGFTAFVSTFFFPHRVGITIPIFLLCFSFFLWFETMGIHYLQDLYNDAEERSHPTTWAQAMQFLTLPDSTTHLRMLLEKPSLADQYQHRYVEMLVDLGAACDWVKDPEDLKETIKEVLEDAYSSFPQKYEPEFLATWRKTLQQLQKQIKKHFGEDHKTFLERTDEKHTYFVTRFRRFKKSKVGKKLHDFLNIDYEYI